MCTHTEELWVKPAVRNLLESLGVPDAKIKLERAHDLSSPVELYQQTVNLAEGELRLSAIVWSPLTTPLKQSLCYDQTNKTDICKSPPLPAQAASYPYSRASVNAELKDSLLNDCLADALAYQGNSREYIVGEVQKAVLYAAANPGGQRAAARGTLSTRAAANHEAMVLISESLGSKVILDSIGALRTSPRPRDRN
ncbi:MAG TPA: hypothetical protein DCQ20_06625, partial [Nitrospira sp.]|nr:hypothetical protein [Nitrospira sp.]